MSLDFTRISRDSFVGLIAFSRAATCISIGYSSSLSINENSISFPKWFEIAPIEIVWLRLCRLLQLHTILFAFIHPSPRLRGKTMTSDSSLPPATDEIRLLLIGPPKTGQSSIANILAGSNVFPVGASSSVNSATPTTQSRHYTNKKILPGKHLLVVDAPV